jgi:hypothetical protein
MSDRALGRPVKWVKVSAVIPADLFVVWQEVIERMEKRGIRHDVEVVRNGMIIEVLSAEYLAGNH